VVLEDFIKLKSEFKNAGVEEKISMYAGTEGLTQTQYRELLLLFPKKELLKLEAVLNGN